MKTSQNGIKFIKEVEGCKLYSYDDLTGLEVKTNGVCTGTLTIGVGHTKGVYKGQKITELQAETLLAIDLQRFEYAVNRLVKVPLTQNQFDALVSFTFNVGEGKEGFAGSTLLKLLNNGDYNGASEQFKRWNLSKGKVMDGLKIRREKEKELFLKK